MVVTHGPRWLNAAIPLTCGALLIALLWTTTLMELGRAEVEARRSAETAASNLARAFEEHVVRTVHETDLILRQLRADVRNDRGNLRPVLDRVREHVFSDLALQVVATDAAGTLVYSSLVDGVPGVDVSDRDYFLALRNGEDELHISRPVVGRVSGKLSVQFARRLTGPDGGFAGVVALSLEPGFFARFYNSIDIGPHGAIALAGLDGVVRASAGTPTTAAEPAGDTALDCPCLPAGQPRAASQTVVSPFDGRSKLAAYRRLEAYPLFVVVQLDEADALADFRQQRESSLSLAVLLTVVLLSGSVAIAWLDDRQARYHASLAAQARQLMAANDDLRQAKAAAERANQAKSSFLAAMSHEFRTPLNGILGFAEIIRDQSFGPDTPARHAGYAADIHECGRELLSLIDQLLDLSKIEAGRLELEREWLDLPELVGSVAHLLAEQAHGKQIDVTIAGLYNPLLLWGDDRAVRQIVFNLLSNAIRYTPNGGHITIRATAEDGGVGITVADSGSGIPHARARTLFSLLPSNGMGIGLPLVKRLVDLHGGSIRIASAIGLGTTAIVRFPAPSAQRPGAREAAGLARRRAKPPRAWRELRFAPTLVSIRCAKP